MYGAYNPYQQQQQQYQQQYQQPVHGFIYVTGIEGAKAYQMPPNSEMPLFDSDQDSDIMYIKTTDGAGFPTIRVGKFVPMEEPPQVQYATSQDIAAIMAEIAALKESMTERRSRGKSVPKAAEQPQQ